MSPVQLLTATFADGLRMPHFVNGRLLSAEDLKADQDAMLARLGWLGEAVGYGVIDGLMVTQAGATSVAVTPGSGLNRDGQLIHLPGALTLNLAPETPVTAAVDEAGRFKICTFQPASSATSVADGAYLLTVLPASRLEGQAPLKPSEGSTLPGGCAGKWEVDGLQFKIIRLAGFDTMVNTAQNRQNLLAHWVLGTEARRKLARSPFTFGETYGGLDQVSAADLTSCDVPLAVFYWQGGSLRFVDAWAARRRLIHPSALVAWQPLLGDRRLAEAEARLMQFQAQIDVLANPQSVRAADVFRYLPPAGFLPLRADGKLVQMAAQQIAQSLQQRLFTAAQGVQLPQVSFSFVNLNFLTLATLLNLLAPNIVSETVAALTGTGFHLETFFEGIEISAVTLVSRDHIDFNVHRSLFSEAIDLGRQPKIRLFLVADQWLRVIGQEMGRIVAQKLSGFPGLSVQLRDFAAAAWLNLVQQELQGDLKDGTSVTAGGADAPQQLYVMFLKERAAAVPVTVRQG